jgi:hypothetical protein
MPGWRPALTPVAEIAKLGLAHAHLGCAYECQGCMWVVEGVRVCIEGMDEGNGISVGKKVPFYLRLQRGRGRRGGGGATKMRGGG